MVVVTSRPARHGRSARSRRTYATEAPGTPRARVVGGRSAPPARPGRPAGARASPAVRTPTARRSPGTSRDAHRAAPGRWCGQARGLHQRTTRRHIAPQTAATSRLVQDVFSASPGVGDHQAPRSALGGHGGARLGADASPWDPHPLAVVVPPGPKGSGPGGWTPARADALSAPPGPGLGSSSRPSRRGPR